MLYFNSSIDALCVIPSAVSCMKSVALYASKLSMPYDSDIRMLKALEAF